MSWIGLPPPLPQYNALFKLGHMNGLFHLANSVVVLWFCASKQIPKQLVRIHQGRQG